MTRVTFRKLVQYLERQCNFHKEFGLEPVDLDGSGVTWTCDNSLAFTKKFCDENNLEFLQVKALLESNGGFCDCEVLFSCVERISEATFLSAKAEARL
jgi:metal-sulfur cluster biosynthetic enzyme